MCIQSSHMTQLYFLELILICSSNHHTVPSILPLFCNKLYNVPRRSLAYYDPYDNYTLPVAHKLNCCVVRFLEYHLVESVRAEHLLLIDLHLLSVKNMDKLCRVS